MFLANYNIAAFLITGASLFLGALMLGLWRVSRERFLLLASLAQLLFALHQWPLFASADAFDTWYWRALFAALFGLYAGLTALVINLLRPPPSRSVLRFTKLYLWSVLPLSFFIFGVHDFTGYISTIYAHHKLTINNMMALAVNFALAVVLVRKFYLLQTLLLQSRLEARFAGERAMLAERQRIMSDIHDTVGAQLVGVIAMLRDGASYQALEAQATLALQELRMAIDALQPIDGNLAVVLATLRHRLQPRLEAAGLTLIWRVDDLPRMNRLSPQTVQHIQRIVIEALSNVIQHAKASEVRLSATVSCLSNHIEVVIEDNGIGFDAAALQATNQAGQGLANVQFRAAQIEAELRFEAPSKMVLTLPFD